MASGFPITINGTVVKTSEALYQSLRFPNYPEIQKRIISDSSPISAKRYGRTQIYKTRKDWNFIRFKIMKFCIEVKMFQNYSAFSKTLLSTNDIPIVEYTDKDKVWGAVLDGKYYTGTNALGRLLMGLREQVKEKKFELTIPQIQGITFLGEDIRLEHLQSFIEPSKQGSIFE